MDEPMRPDSPVGAEPIDEVPLACAPLEKVLCQIRFANLAVFHEDGYQKPFVKKLVDEYPILDEGHQVQITLDPSGQIQHQETSGRVWLLRSLDRTWTVTLSQGSLALETVKYTSRAAFMTRFTAVRQAFAAVFGGVLSDRIGIRYVNRILTSTLSADELLSMTYPEIRGPMAAYGVPDSGLQHGISDMVLNDGGCAVQVKWGITPPNVSYDPMVAPVAEQSWFLDIDSSSTAPDAIGGSEIGSRLGDLAQREYRTFRWIVTPKFIERFRE